MRHTLANTLQRGLSLIELMVTLSIAVILLTIGVPSFVDMMSSNTASSYANDLLADINYARSEAITRGSRVVVCKGAATATGSGCTTGNWEEGWKVFEDCNDNRTINTATCPDRNGDGALDDEEVLRVHAALSNGWTLRGNNNVTNRITFLPDGRTNNNGTLVACKDGVLNVGNQTRSGAVIVNVTGRARVSPDSNGDGVPDDAAGCNL
ncbi:MAG: GspH/FimT family pseudopilin [Pseudomonadota bacterium]|nr:GspH/FimT family pseudopilin [Pseudomonadota bacterium]MDP1902841.1 GspH/FimT family pseudopilin [Pseudomonadota bacterium]MDP2352845.1 GspH/FimT family pseudopilin [Pseudomonadota bacterium]